MWILIDDNMLAVLNALESVWVSKFIQMKSLLKIYLVHHPSLSHVMLSVLFNKYRVKNFVRDIRNVTHIRQDAAKGQSDLMKARDSQETVNYKKLKDTGKEVENINLDFFWLIHICASEALKWYIPDSINPVLKMQSHFCVPYSWWPVGVDMK